MHSIFTLEEPGKVRYVAFDEWKKFGIRGSIKSRKPRQDLGPKTSSLFGRKIHELPLESVRVSPDQDYMFEIPSFVITCCQKIVSNKETEGVFRKAGSAKRQKESKLALNNGESLDEELHVIDVANILKQFFSELPEPLIPRSLHDIFISCSQLNENQVEVLQLSCLMISNLTALATLCYVCQVLHVLAASSSLNRMKISNLASFLVSSIMPLAEQAKWPRRNQNSTLRSHKTVIELLIKNSAVLGMLPDCILPRIFPQRFSAKAERRGRSRENLSTGKKKRRSASFSRNDIDGNISVDDDTIDDTTTETGRKRTGYRKGNDSLYVNLTGNASCLLDLKKTSVEKPIPKHDISVCESELMEGEYGEHYGSCRVHGSGGFGYVFLGYRKVDSLMVITKFIQKSKVHKNSWVNDDSGKKVPLEVILLRTFSHKNIVQVLDVYENEKFIQMVMEKHGNGMDLFAFIENHPHLDEPLASYIFRQIVSAVEYIHKHSIIHSDIKDENIIIDENFHVKLIDFGSAAKMEGKLFNDFCGTYEYCSPEVLEENPYRGPELEVWSLGVTLYVLIYEKNPFKNVEEIIRANYVPAFDVSELLNDLLFGMFEKKPKERWSMEQVVNHDWLRLDVNPSDYHFFDMITELYGTSSKYYQEDDEGDADSSSGRHSVSESSSITALATLTPFRATRDPRTFSEDSLLEPHSSRNRTTIKKTKKCRI